MGGCAAIGCLNHSRKKNRMFRFPKEADRRRKWIENCGLNPHSLAKVPYLCIDHFDKNQFEKDGELKSNAVPTLFDKSKDSSSAKEMTRSSKANVVSSSESDKIKSSDEFILPTTSDVQENVVEPWNLFTLNIKKEPEDIIESADTTSVAEQSIFTIKPVDSPIDKEPITVESLFTAEQDDQASAMKILTAESSNSGQSSSYSNNLVSPKIEPLSSDDEETLSALSGTVLSPENSTMDSPNLIKIKEEPMDEQVQGLLASTINPIELPLDDITPNLQAAFGYTLLPASQKGSTLHQVLILKTRNECLRQENRVLQERFNVLAERYKKLSSDKVQKMLSIQKFEKRNKNMNMMITQLGKRNRILSKNVEICTRMLNKDRMDLKYATNQLNRLKQANRNTKIVIKEEVIED